MTGTRAICQKLRARCPHCNECLDLTEIGGELFRRIFKELKATGRVEAEGFGVFRLAVMPARTVANFGRNKVTIPAMRVVRFKASKHLKAKLNKDRMAKNDKETND